MLEVLRRATLVLYRLLPKFDHAVLWGWPDNEDSVLALERALQDTAIRTVVVLVTDEDAPVPTGLGSKTRRVRKDSIRGLGWFLFARHVFFTHRCFMWEFPDNVVAVNVWHGMPIKRVCWLSPGDRGIGSTYTLATSPEWAAVMDEAMGPRRGVLTVGLPRNDRLFADGEATRRALGLDPDRKLVFWLPTYRRSVRGHLTTDGSPSTPPFEMPIDIHELRAVLGDCSATLLVKPHPMSEQVPIDTTTSVWVIDDAWIRDRGLSLYSVVGACDVLVSDVSSVVVDYLLVDRPVIHAMADLDEYRRSRGFSIEPVDDLFSGPVVTDGDELCAALRRTLAGHDDHRDVRQRVRDRCHTHQDDRSTNRLLAAVGLIDADSVTGTPARKDLA